MAASAVSRTAAQTFAALRRDLQAVGSAKVAAEKAAYFKNVCKFIGVKTPEIEAIYARHAAQLSTPPLACTLDVARQCLADGLHEVKQIGIVALVKTSTRVHETLESSTQCLDMVEGAFDAGHVYDWATTDGLTRVTSAALKAHRELADRIVGWRSAENIWKRRASAVSFVRVASPEFGFDTHMLTVAEDALRSQERFVQLGVGWMLREYGVKRQAELITFLKSHITMFSREGLRYAVEKLPAARVTELVELHHTATPAAGAPPRKSEPKTKTAIADVSVAVDAGEASAATRKRARRA